MFSDALWFFFPTKSDDREVTVLNIIEKFHDTHIGQLLSLSNLILFFSISEFMLFPAKSISQR